MSEDESGVIRGRTPTTQEVLASPPQKSFQRVVIHRMTVSEKVYYQVDGGNPEGIETFYEKHLQSGEEIYQRKTKLVAGELTPIDLGWLAGKKITSILIKNLEDGKVPDFQKTITVKHGDIAIITIPPGESVRFNPLEAEKLSLYTDSITKYLLNVIPG